MAITSKNTIITKFNINDAVYKRAAGGKVNYSKEQEVKLETFW